MALDLHEISHPIVAGSRAYRPEIPWKYLNRSTIMWAVISSDMHWGVNPRE